MAALPSRIVTPLLSLILSANMLRVHYRSLSERLSNTLNSISLTVKSSKLFNWLPVRLNHWLIFFEPENSVNLSQTFKSSHLVRISPVWLQGCYGKSSLNNCLNQGKCHPLYSPHVQSQTEGNQASTICP